MLKIAVNEAQCVGHGRCYALAPDVFGPDDFGHCELLVDAVAVGSALESQARLGAQNCPEQAIVLTEA